MAQSAADSFRQMDGLAAVREWEAEHGEFDEADRERTAAEFAAIDTAMFGSILNEDRGCSIVDMTEDLGRQAGVLCGVAGTCDVVDATVVILAMRANAAILTSDPQDIGKLVDAARPRIRPSIVTVQQRVRRNTSPLFPD